MYGWKDVPVGIRFAIVYNELAYEYMNILENLVSQNS